MTCANLALAELDGGSPEDRHFAVGHPELDAGGGRRGGGQVRDAQPRDEARVLVDGEPRGWGGPEGEGEGVAIPIGRPQGQQTRVRRPQLHLQHCTRVDDPGRLVLCTDQFRIC